MILAGRNAGNPWHGTWTEDGLELPNAAVMELPVAVAGGAGIYKDLWYADELRAGGRHGDCLLVRVPDVPVPETTEAETALGMEWLNYALISGANRLLYGVPLGPSRWVYIDDNDEAWIAKFQTTTIRFSRLVFGGSDVVTESHTLWGFSATPVVLDAAETGRGITMGAIGLAGAQYSMTLQSYRYVFSGVPGVDFSATGVAVSDDEFSATPELWETEGGAMDLTSGSFSSIETLDIPWIFDGDDPVELRFSVSYDAPACDYDPVADLYEERTITGTVSVVTSFGSFDKDFETIAGPWTPYAPIPCAGTCDDWTFTGDNAFFPMAVAVRQTNKVVEVVFLSQTMYTGMEDIEVHSICRVFPDHFEATGVTTTYEQIPAYMTYHPVSKELLESDSPVCFM